MKKRSYIIVLVFILICIGGVGYYLGYSGYKYSSELSETDIHGTYCEEKNITNTVNDYVYVSINAEDKEFYLFYVGSREIIDQGSCDIGNNICVMKGSRQQNVLVYTDENYYWIDGEGMKHKVYKVSSAATMP